MSIYCNKDAEVCFTDLPFHSMVAEWLRMNVQLSFSTASLVAQVALFLLTWYTVKFALKLVLNLAWPVVLILCGYVAVQLLRTSDAEFPEIFLLYIDAIYHCLASNARRVLNYVCRTLGSKPPLYPTPY